METTLTRNGGHAARFLWVVPGRLRDALEAQRGALMPWSAVAFGMGTALYFVRRSEPSEATLLMLGALALLCAAAVIPPRLAPIRLVLVATLLVIAGFSGAAWRTATVAAPVLEYRTYGPVTGRIIRIDRSASEKPRLMLDQVHMSRIAPAKTPARVRISLHGEQTDIAFRPGDFVMATAHLSPPPGPAEPGGFDFQRHAWFERLGAVGYTRVPVLRYAPRDTDSPALGVGRLRLDLAERILAAVGGREGPFAAAILTGDRSAIPAGALTALRQTNLAHLLAISGLHMGLLTGVVFALLRYGLAMWPQVALRLPTKKIAAVVALFVGLFYLVLSGANVATQRAFIMVAVMLLAICLDRRALTLRAVALAALIVLAIRPESIYGPGFQMSFAATTALVAGFRFWRDRGLGQHIPGYLRGISGVAMSSFIAGLATAPFAAAHFNMFAQYGLIANLLSVPVMGAVVMPGAVMAGLLSPLGLDAVGFWVMAQGLGWILWVAEWVSGLDGAVSRLATPAGWALPVVAAGGLFLCLWQGPARLLGLGPILLALFFWNAAPRPDLLLADTGNLIGVMTPEGRALNKPKGDGFAARIWLENDGDTATQEEAHQRLSLSRNLVLFEQSGISILYDRRKDLTLTELDRLCTAHDVVLAVQSLHPMPCRGVSASDLTRTGSIAITVSETGQVALHTANGLRGQRPWVPRPDKRAGRRRP